MQNTHNETERIKALHRYEILDTPPDGTFDKITAVASKIFGMPIAIVSLVDEDRIWFKSQVGVDGVEQIEKAPGLCASAILSDDVYLVEDAKNDPRTLANPLVCGEFGLRFYAAAPLRTQDGHNLGTLCVIDKRQRYLSREQEGILKDLAGIVMDEIEIRLAARNALAKSNDRIIELEQQVQRLQDKN